MIVKSKSTNEEAYNILLHQASSLNALMKILHRRSCTLEENQLKIISCQKSATTIILQV